VPRETCKRYEENHSAATLLDAGMVDCATSPMQSKEATSSAFQAFLAKVPYTRCAEGSRFRLSTVSAANSDDLFIRVRTRMDGRAFFS
jgi:hypothetical protein